MQIEEIKSELIGIIIKLLGKTYKELELIEYIDLFDDLGINSITFVSLVVEIEVHFNIVIPDYLLLMEYFRNVNDIVLIIESLLINDNINKE